MTMDYIFKAITIASIFSSNSVIAVHYDISNVYCLRQGLCQHQQNEEIFTCVKHEMECCTNATGSLVLQEAPRGYLCCEGSGLYNPQTHACSRDSGIERLPTTRHCPTGRETMYNENNQICCQAPNSLEEPKVHFWKAGYTCCGDSYINGAYQGCCANRAFDLATQCCQGGEITSTHMCKVTEACGKQRIDCSDETIGRRLGKWKRTFHVVMVTVGKSKSIPTSNEMKYRVRNAKRLFFRKSALSVVRENKLKSITLPKCNCLGHLRAGESYILFLKFKPRKSLTLNRRNSFVIPASSTDIFTQLFS